MKKVLIVEDEAILRNGIATLIDWNGLGFVVAGKCNNGVEALKFLEVNKVDLVVSDIKMPLMGGLELAKNIKALFFNSSIILLTAFSDFQFAQQAIKLGVDDYVLKKDFVKSLPNAVKILYEKSIFKMHSVNNNAGSKLDHLLFKGILEGLITDTDEVKSFLDRNLINHENFYVCAIEVLETDSTINTDETVDKPEPPSLTSFLDSAFSEFPNFHSTFSPNHIYLVIGSKKNEVGLSNRLCAQFVATSEHGIIKLH